MAKTWGGRFSGDTDNRVEAFTESISFDRRLYRHDVVASQAHARMLAEVGILTAVEAEQIATTLTDIAQAIERGDFEFSIKLEDIHTHIERALIERLGDVGRKLHTGRSRNDQVVTDVRLWVRDSIDTLDGRLKEMQVALLASAERDRDLVLPGYTHMQRAQPILAAHYFLAFIEKYQRDRERLADCRRRVNVLSLGTAALAGTSVPIDRGSVATKLGFASVAANSLDVSSDRDFVLEFVFGLTVIALHLGGWAEEWILWSTTEFNFLDLPDAFCTGSSIMPHKKNPDVLELIRGKTARVAGDLQRLVMLIKGLPLAYNRDLQEDKEALFDAYDTVHASLEVAAALVHEARFRREVIAGRLEDGYLDATTLMEFLVMQGVPLRSAHEAVGKLVRLCEEKRCRLAQLPAEIYDSIRQGLGSKVYNVLGVPNALAAFRSYGSTAPGEVEEQIKRWRAHGWPDAAGAILAMDLFSYKNRNLYCEDVSIAALAEQYGTPLYAYSQGTLLHHLQALQTAFAGADPLICYSIKTNPNIHLARLMVERGAGCDVTSAGELYRALKADCPAAHIVFAGVGKTDAELKYGLESGILFFNVESEGELLALGEVARSLGKVAKVALRVNPDLPPKTHAKTDTSVKGVKFGLDIDTVLEFAQKVVRSSPCANCGAPYAPGFSHSESRTLPTGDRQGTGADRQASCAGTQDQLSQHGRGFWHQLP